MLTTLGEHIRPESVTQNFPSIRFSEEIYYMLNVLNERMREHEIFTKHYYAKQEDLICSQLLGLTF